MRKVFSELRLPGGTPTEPVDDAADFEAMSAVEAELEPLPDDDPQVAAAAPQWGEWCPDRCLPGYQMRTLTLVGVESLPEENGSQLTATLVRRNEPTHDRAVLYIHGWNDYFFQTHMADAWDALGYDFYALDLRRYGRSLHADELPGYVTNLDEYDVEIDAAIDELASHHDEVVLSAHSTGGLVSALWADRHPGRLAGLVLNSPWIELQGSAMFRTLATPVINGLATRAATWAIPMADNGVYANSLHTSGGGEWAWDPDLKRNPSNPVRPGWLRAILRGHERVAAGLAIEVPVLMMISSKSDFRRVYDGPVLDADMVLDVSRLASRAPNLGWHVTLVRIEGGVHDLVLSPPKVREIFFDELARWERAYLRDELPALTQ